MALEWEKIETNSPYYGYEDTVAVYRAKVPGGWLVWVCALASGMTFYPDPNHEWKL